MLHDIQIVSVFCRPKASCAFLMYYNDVHASLSLHGFRILSLFSLVLFAFLKFFSVFQYFPRIHYFPAHAMP